jgi:uncharacterized protein (DUF1499 family)
MTRSYRSLIMVLLIGCCWLGMIRSSVAQSLSAMLSLTPVPEIVVVKKSLFSFAGQAPTNLGVTAGQLAPCPDTPNCVSSQATDAEHQIAPIAYGSSPAEAMTQLKGLVNSLDRSKIISATDDYLYAEFTSALMGFVDDVEFYFDPNTPGQLQVRSASRLGQSDLGVNRQRIESIHSQFDALRS